MKLPIYDPSTPIPVAWEQLISSIASMEMEDCDIPDLPEDEYDNVIQVSQTPTIQLLRLFPYPSRDHWFPSWAQIQQYPDVSVKDDVPILAPEGTDYSLHIMSGRVYRDCTLQLIQPSTPETKAIYLSTMDGKDAQLVATVPGIELQIDPGSRYVLVDISPDRSLWPYADEDHCNKTGIGHEHLPIWQESVIVICEEVDTLAQPAIDTVKVAEGSSAVMKYRLRRVTTLEWDCKISGEPGPGRWLPFEPSLVHLRSVVCSAKGGREHVYLLDPEEDEVEDGDGGQDGDQDEDGDPDLNVFCDPEAMAGLLNQEGWHEEWYKRWPLYGVYLV